MIDMTGKKYGMLTVIESAGISKNGKVRWRCKCDCGNETVADGYKIRSGHTTSCGCLQAALRKRGPNHTHGMTNTRLYVTWSNMKARCNNPKCYEFHAYGGNGIRICEAWSKFENFYEWAMATGYTDELTIDRIDVNGNYCPENCRWLSYKEQALNRTDNHLITAFGKTMTIREWADASGIKYDTIERRINGYGWDVERAVSEPASYGPRKKN